ncbi:MAG: rRNA maturation RNase YbeY [Pseudomarimonas sp.]
MARAGVPAPHTFRKWMAVALPKRRSAVAIALRVVDEVEARQLNQQFRGRDYATNVLSFPDKVIDPVNGTRFIGDIAICAPVVIREALEQGKAVRAHFAHMTIHGVLHLLGHDHVDEADAVKMETLERQLLASLGISDPYI